MQNNVDPVDGAPAGLEIADIAFDEVETLETILADALANVLEVAAPAGREIVEAAHILAKVEQRLDEIRSDEAGRSGHQPRPSSLAERSAKVRVPRVSQPVGHCRYLFSCPL